VIADVLQDGFLERLTPNEFICLSQTIDDFVTSTEQISGRRCMTLRTAVQNQVQTNVHMLAGVLVDLRVLTNLIQYIL